MSRLAISISSFEGDSPEGNNDFNMEKDNNSKLYRGDSE
jgi:hypothetical protein